LPVGLVEVGDLGHKRVVRVRVGEKGTNRQKHFGDGERRAPLLSEDVQADAPVAVDVGVVDFCCEVEFWGFEGIVRRELNVQEENTALVWAVPRTHNCSLPVKHIIPDWPRTARQRGIPLYILEFFCNSFESHFWSRVSNLFA